MEGTDPMSMNRLIVSQAILWAITSVFLLLAPATLLGWFAMHDIPSQQSLARIFGSELAGLTLASYFTRHLVYTRRRKNLALAYTASNTLGFVVTLDALLGEAMSRFTWALSALYLIYALAFAYYTFLDPTEYEHRLDGARAIFE